MWHTMYKYRLPIHYIRPSIGQSDIANIGNLYNFPLNYHHTAPCTFLYHMHILYSCLRNVHRNLF